MIGKHDVGSLSHRHGSVSRERKEKGSHSVRSSRSNIFSGGE